MEPGYAEANENGIYGFLASINSFIYGNNAQGADNVSGTFSPTASTADFPYFGNDGAWIYGGTETESKVVLEEIQAEDATGLVLKNDGGTTVATANDAGNLALTGALTLNSVTLSDAGPTDNQDVGGKNILILDVGSNAVTLGGLANGVAGQILFVRVYQASNDAKIEHAEGGSTQGIYLSDGADETITAGGFGGWVLLCTGTAWIEIAN